MRLVEPYDLATPGLSTIAIDDLNAATVSVVFDDMVSRQAIAQVAFLAGLAFVSFDDDSCTASAVQRHLDNRFVMPGGSRPFPQISFFAHLRVG